MAGEVLSQGTKLQRGDGAAPEVFQDVPGVTGITGLMGGEAAEIPSTDLDSVGIETLPGLPDGGTITANIKRLMDNAVQDLVEDDYRTQRVGNWRVRYRNGKYRQFTAWVKSFPEDAATNELVRGGLTLRVSGLPSVLQV